MSHQVASDMEKGHVEAHTAYPQENNGGYPHAHTSTLAAAAVPTKIANPATLGLWSFASTTFILSAYNAQIEHITAPNLVVGMALFTGGLAQFMAGMWEFPRGNTFGATAFTSYGAFWLSYATILIPGSGVGAAYTDKEMFENAVGFFLTAWFLVTFFLFIASFRKNMGLSVLFGLLSVTFLLLLLGAFLRNVKLTRAGGGAGIATAFVAYYIGLADLLSDEKKPLVKFPLAPYKYD
ncbi:FUN34 transmembrane protein [Flagelloscypha sp. PMI_526]|nr:FUN34 transmembrane protein [Flagelloscypha sp. PMI_526]